jgi:hypothetical protein
MAGQVTAPTALRKIKTVLDLCANPAPRIERRTRILENHLNTS